MLLKLHLIHYCLEDLALPLSPAVMLSNNSGTVDRTADPVKSEHQNPLKRCYVKTLHTYPKSLPMYINIPQSVNCISNLKDMFAVNLISRKKNENWY